MLLSVPNVMATNDSFQLDQIKHQGLLPHGLKETWKSL